jgi:hypothetical protein
MKLFSIDFGFPTWGDIVTYWLFAAMAGMTLGVAVVLILDLVG